MNVEIRPISEINQQATELLVREIGIVDALRFFSQFNTGTGNYTKERNQWLDNLTLEQITSEIKAKRQST